MFFSILQAAVSSDPVDRMTLVAAFAVSAYGYCTARAGHKPFNPLLGETFERTLDFDTPIYHCASISIKTI